MAVLYTLLGLVALVIGAEIMIRGAVALALRFHISPLVIGLTIVAMGTSMPELLVSLLAALKGSPELAVGNVVGSNVINISFILGASILIFPIEVDREARRIHWPVMMIVSLVFVLYCWNGLMSRFEGIVFVLLLVLYVVAMIRTSRRKQLMPGALPTVTHAPLWRSTLQLIVGIAALAFGADRFVEGAVQLANILGVSDQLVGVTIVAVGTSLPELITSLMAAFRKQPDISLGNLVGSNIFNLLGILGITAAISPIPVDLRSFSLDVSAMILVALILFPLMFWGKKLGRPHGAILFLAYIVYVYFVIDRG